MTPDLQDYSEAVQARAAEEIAAIPEPPCNAQQTEQLGGCSALKLMVPKYLQLRDRIRAVDTLDE